MALNYLNNCFEAIPSFRIYKLFVHLVMITRQYSISIIRQHKHGNSIKSIWACKIKAVPGVPGFANYVMPGSCLHIHLVYYHLECRTRRICTILKQSSRPFFRQQSLLLKTIPFMFPFLVLSKSGAAHVTSTLTLSFLLHQLFMYFICFIQRIRITL